MKTKTTMQALSLLMVLALAGAIFVPVVGASNTKSANENLQKIQIPDLQVDKSKAYSIITESLSPMNTESKSIIPLGAIIHHSNDGNTYVFDSTGKQILIASDAEATEITTPEGLQPATTVHEVPQGALILDSQTNKNTTFVFSQDGELLFTVIDDKISEKSIESRVNLVGGWIVWAEKTVSQISYLRSRWYTPSAPTQMTNPFALAIFNGLENSETIIQPVLEYNYGLNNPEWTMTSWRVSSGSSYYSPRHDVDQGDNIEGTLQYTTINGQTGWLVTTADLSKGTSTYYFTNVISSNSNLEIVNTLEIAQGGTSNPYDMCGDITFNNVNIPQITLNPGYTTVPMWYGMFDVVFNPNPTQVTLVTP
ncbi:conserved hypothetical protein [Methanolacinia petrolearia DSM 11571]|uniref:Uncharacterized protein n=1 Tax=Methanolacinia petrolearia (strain DSM 11571 / OCM 486 / SEBR 4847) TaxID=679926 RepID=E1RG70_METP4|nr:hypothetical protein [Methanolacinia petrolearia]ADN36305.1 conserved hypothetical protein [Methanolacinia petrolearia DSM 11571]